MDGVGQMWMGLVRCGWGWLNVDGIGYFSGGVDNFCFEVMGTEGKEDIVPKGQHAMSEDHALGSLHITVLNIAKKHPNSLRNEVHVVIKISLASGSQRPR